jgi:hypothetical protein
MSSLATADDSESAAAAESSSSEPIKGILTPLQPVINHSSTSATGDNNRYIKEFLSGVSNE